MNNPRQMSQLYVCFFFMTMNPTKMLLINLIVSTVETMRIANPRKTPAPAASSDSVLIS